MKKIDPYSLFGDFFFYLIISISTLTFLFTVNLDVNNIDIGNDIRVFCKAGAAITADKNPYITSNIGGDLSWNYPSIIAEAFAFACPRLNLENTYIGYYSIPLIFGLIPWLIRKDWLYGFILTATGLYSFGWVIITGNISTFEFLLFSISVHLFTRKRKEYSAFILGIMSGTKLIPFLYMPVLFFTQKNVKETMKILLWATAGLLIIPVLSLVTSHQMFGWYLRQLLGLIPGQHSPISELTASPFNPSFSMMLFSILKFEPSSVPMGYLAASLVVYILGPVLIFAVIAPRAGKNSFLLYCLGCIVLTIVLPRLKPYSFLPYLLCFYLVSRQQSNLVKGTYLLLLSVIPTLLHLIYFYIENSDNLFRSDILQTIFTLNQIFFACLATGLLIFNILRDSKHQSPESS